MTMNSEAVDDAAVPDAAPVHAEELPGPYEPSLHYKRQAIPNSQQDGLFASKDIKAGTRIIWEFPLITLPFPGDQPVEVIEAFEALASDDQKRILSLNGAPASAAEFLMKLLKKIHKSTGPLRALKDKPEQQRTGEEQEFLNGELARILGWTEVFDIIARWHAGSHSLVQGLPETAIEQLPPSVPVSGLFIEKARLRYSCIPNCYGYVNPSSNVMSIYVTTNVPAGTELTLPSISDGFYDDAATRALHFKENSIPSCNCPACDSSHPHFRMHEDTRVRLHESLSNTRRLFTTIEDTPTLGLFNFANDALQSIIDDLKRTGCTDLTLVQWYDCIFRNIYRNKAILMHDKGEHKEALEYRELMFSHAMECVRIGTKCLGAKHEKVVAMRERANKFWVVVKKVQERLEV